MDCDLAQRVAFFMNRLEKVEEESSSTEACTDASTDNGAGRGNALES